MEIDEFTKKVGEFTVIFKTEGESLIIRAVSIAQDFLLSAKYTTDNLPKEVKFLFRTPQRLFSRLIKNEEQSFFLNTDNTLVIKLNLADLGDEIQIPLPLEKKPMDLQLKCRILQQELATRNEQYQHHQREIQKLREQNKRLSLHQEVHPLNHQGADKNHHQQPHEDVKKYKKKYDEVNMELINLYFEFDNLKKQLEESQKKVQQLQEEMRIVKENSDRMVSSIHSEYEKKYEEKVKQEVEKMELSPAKSDQTRSKHEAQMEEEARRLEYFKNFDKFDFSWNKKSLHAEIFKFNDKRVRKNQQQYEHHQVYSTERVPNTGKFQVIFKILAYGNSETDIIFGLMSSARCKQDFSGGQGHPKSLGYWSDQLNKRGKIIVDGSQVRKGADLYVKKGDQLTMRVDMDIGKVYWCNNQHQVETSMFKNYQHENIYVFAAMMYENDSICVQ